MKERLLRPSILILIAANLLPLVGVMFWHWDGFVLLMLYWLETAVIAFWTVVRLAFMPRTAVGDMHFEGSDKPATPVALALFFTVHAGIFMLVHFFFLWELFSNERPRNIHNVHEFVSQLIVATGLWVPLGALFIARGALTLFAVMQPVLLRLFRIKHPAAAESEISLNPAEAMLFGLYLRIFVMQATLILGVWFILLTGSSGAYVFLIALKTSIDVAFELRPNLLGDAVRRAKAKAARTAET
jgi:hypothetical protein